MDCDVSLVGDGPVRSVVEDTAEDASETGVSVLDRVPSDSVSISGKEFVGCAQLLCLLGLGAEANLS